MTTHEKGLLVFFNELLAYCQQLIVNSESFGLIYILG